MTQQGISYTSRDFKAIRADLIEYIKHNYPNYYTDFNDASIGMMLIELNAALGDMLSFNTDRAYQENLIDFAQERKSLFNLARTYGLKIPNKIPSITICEISADIPVKGAGFDISYCPILLRGAQVTGNGLIFETVHDVDFSNPFSQNGFPNRTITPNFDSLNNVVSYTLTKKEIVTNGQTKYFKKVITPNESRPFLEIVLPESDIIKVESIISLNGSDYNRLPTISEWNNEDNKWYEVDTLKQNDIFVSDIVALTDNKNIKKGSWKTIKKKYLTDFTDNGYCIIRFGGGIIDNNANDYNLNISDILSYFKTQNNIFDFGEIPRQNTTIFVKYRIGGGVRTNIGSNTLNSFGNINLVVIGANPVINTDIRNSLRINNIVPAIGGRDELSVEELRNLIRYNFNAQDRCVTLEDYVSRISLMKSDFGKPYKFNVSNIKNKVTISTVGINENNKLDNTSTNTLKENLLAYLDNYKILSDIVEVLDGKIINLGVILDVVVGNGSNKVDLTNQISNIISTYFETNQSFGNSIYISKIYEILHGINDILSIKNISFILKNGNNYSVNTPNLHQISATNDVILNNGISLDLDYNEILELKYPDIDIKINYTVL